MAKNSKGIKIPVEQAESIKPEDNNEIFSELEITSKRYNDLIIKGLEKVQQERKKLEKEKALFEINKKKLENVQVGTTIVLDIGGDKFKTNLSNLMKAGTDSVFTHMFSGNWKLQAAEDGSFFIDRDGTHFRYILNFLRTGELVVPDNPDLIRELRIEVDFYNITALIDALTPKEVFLQCTLLSFDEQKKIK